MMNRFISRMASGSSRWVRTQTCSQRWLHARPRIAPSGLSWRTTSTASSNRPSRTRPMYCGTFWFTGHSSVHGALMQSNSPSGRTVFVREVSNVSLR